MKPVGSLKKLLSFAVAAFALLGVVSAEAAPKSNKAIVRAVRGTADYSSDKGATWKKLSVGTSLNEQSTIKTAAGANVDLFLGDNGPVVRVTPDTILGLDKLTSENTGNETVIETQLDLRNGRILGNVKKLAAASKYEIKTPQGVAGIRGTKYDISANGQITVTEGSVMVVYIVNGQATRPVLVSAGQTVSPPSSPNQLPTVLPAAQALLNNINADLDEATANIQIRGRTVSGVVAIPVAEDPELPTNDRIYQNDADRRDAAFEVIKQALREGRLTVEQAREALKNAGFTPSDITDIINRPITP